VGIFQRAVASPDQLILLASLTSDPFEVSSTRKRPPRLQLQPLEIIPSTAPVAESTRLIAVPVPKTDQPGSKALVNTDSGVSKEKTSKKRNIALTGEVTKDPEREVKTSRGRILRTNTKFTEDGFVAARKLRETERGDKKRDTRSSVKLEASLPMGTNMDVDVDVDVDYDFDHDGDGARPRHDVHRDASTTYRSQKRQAAEGVISVDDPSVATRVSILDDLLSSIADYSSWSLGVVAANFSQDDLLLREAVAKAHITREANGANRIPVIDLTDEQIVLGMPPYLQHDSLRNRLDRGRLGPRYQAQVPDISFMSDPPSSSDRMQMLTDDLMPEEALDDGPAFSPAPLAVGDVIVAKTMKNRSFYGQYRLCCITRLYTLVIEGREESIIDVFDGKTVCTLMPACKHMHCP
jgi:hypothetical protein